MNNEFGSSFIGNVLASNEDTSNIIIVPSVVSKQLKTFKLIKIDFYQCIFITGT